MPSWRCWPAAAWLLAAAAAEPREPTIARAVAEQEPQELAIAQAFPEQEDLEEESCAGGECALSLAQMRGRKVPEEPEPVLAVHFIRHGEVHNPQEILYGQMPGFHLSPKGFEQAAAGADDLATSRALVAERYGFARVSAVKYSPMLRTRETAEVLAAAADAADPNSGLTSLMEAEPDVIEVWVPYQGQPLAEIKKLNFNIYSHGQEAEDKGYENFQDVVHRVVRFVGQLALSPAHRGAQVVVVTHGDIALIARLWATQGLSALRASGPGKPKAAADMPYPGHVSLTTLVFAGQAPFERPVWVQA